MDLAMVSDEEPRPFREMVENYLEDLISMDLADSLRSEAATLRRERKHREDLEFSIGQRYAVAFDEFEHFLILNRRAGSRLNRRYGEIAHQKNDLTYLALVRNHARASAIGSEIYALMRTGHANGASARWRTLHELMVVGMFLREHGQDTAQRYLDHETIRIWRDAVAYRDMLQSHLSGEDQELLEELSNRRKELMIRYGKEFSGDWGWAADNITGNPTFARIEQAVDLGEWRLQYSLASHSVHAGIRGFTYDLGSGSHRDDPGFLAAGASNSGVIEPAINTVFSMSNITTTLLAHASEAHTAIEIHVLLRLREIAIHTLDRADEQLQDDIRKHGSHVVFDDAG